jgi:hypothetical protein
MRRFADAIPADVAAAHTAIIQWNLPDEIDANPGHRSDDLKARNRVAAKKWRDKKDETLYQLEATNDHLREEALRLRNSALNLRAENAVLEEELQFFQSFMSKIMNVGAGPDFFSAPHV